MFAHLTVIATRFDKKYIYAFKNNKNWNKNSFWREKSICMVQTESLLIIRRKENVHTTHGTTVVNRNHVSETDVQ